MKSRVTNVLSMVIAAISAWTGGIAESDSVEDDQGSHLLNAAAPEFFPGASSWDGHSASEWVHSHHVSAQESQWDSPTIGAFLRSRDAKRSISIHDLVWPQSSTDAMVTPPASFPTNIESLASSDVAENISAMRSWLSADPQHCAGRRRASRGCHEQGSTAVPDSRPVRNAKLVSGTQKS